MRYTPVAITDGRSGTDTDQAPAVVSKGHKVGNLLEVRWDMACIVF